MFVDLCLNLFSSECCYKCEKKKSKLNRERLMESMVLVLGDQVGSTKQVFLIFFPHLLPVQLQCFHVIYMTTGRNMENIP